MTTTTSTGFGTGANTDRTHTSVARRLTTETKAAFKTTEFFAYLVAVVGVLIASAVSNGPKGSADGFDASHAWFYITLLTLGYMVSRGLAKAGSREPYDRDDHVVNR